MLLRYCLEKKKKEIIKHFQHHPSHLATGASVSLSLSRPASSSSQSLVPPAAFSSYIIDQLDTPFSLLAGDV